MKNRFLSLAFLLPCIPALHAQSWFENNPQWAHFYSLGWVGTGYEYSMVSGDTILNGLEAKVVNRIYEIDSNSGTTGFAALRQTGDSIWSWYQGDFHLIYNFSLQAGDTLTVTINSNALCRYVVDSIGLMDVGGQMLRFQQVRWYPDPASLFACPSLIIEKMGMVLGNCYNPNAGSVSAEFFFYESSTAIFDGSAWLFCRFQNDQLEYAAPYSACAELSGVSEVSPEDSLFRVAPNPFGNGFSVDALMGEHVKQVRIFNYSGQLCMSVTAPRIEAGHLPPGLYFVEITSGKNEKTFFKVVKNR